MTDSTDGPTQPFRTGAPAAPGVLLLFAAAGLLAIPGVAGAFGISPDLQLLRALVYVELSAPLLVLWYLRPRGRRDLSAILLSTLVAWLAAGSVLFVLGFLARSPLALDTRALSFGAWLAVSGLLAAESVLSRGAIRGTPSGARVLAASLMGLPVLWHYFGLEYSGASLLHLRAISPQWILAAHPELDWDRFSYWPLYAAGVAAWGIAFAFAPRAARHEPLNDRASSGEQV